MRAVIYIFIQALFVRTRCLDSDPANDELYDYLASYVGEDNIKQVLEMVPDEVQDEVQRKFQEIFVLIFESLNKEQTNSFLMKINSDMEEGENEVVIKAKILEIIRLVQNNQPDKLKKSFDELNKIKRIYDESKEGAEMDEKFLHYVGQMGTYLSSPQGAKVNEKIKERFYVIKTYLEGAKAAGLRRCIRQFVDALRP